MSTTAPPVFCSKCGLELGNARMTNGKQTWHPECCPVMSNGPASAAPAGVEAVALLIHKYGPPSPIEAWMHEAATALASAQAREAELRAKLAYAEQANSTRPEYDLRCEECGRAHVLDTVLPSEIWNQIAESGNLLCVVCIDKRLAAKGLKAEAEFYFCGNALLSKLYNDESAEQALEAAAAERDEFRACLAVQCGQTLVAKSQLETAAAEKRVLLDALAAYDKLSLVIASAVGNYDTDNLDQVVAAVNAGRAALAAGEPT